MGWTNVYMDPSDGKLFCGIFHASKATAVLVRDSTLGVFIATIESELEPDSTDEWKKAHGMD